jgi:tetratricopeptide (TPR) repeat protein
MKKVLFVFLMTAIGFGSTCSCGASITNEIESTAAVVSSASQGNIGSLSPKDVAARFARLRRQQVREMALDEGISVPAEFERIFDAVENSDWLTVSNLWASLRSRTERDEGSGADLPMQTVLWQPVLETIGFFEQVNLWDANLLSTYANEMLESLPPHCVYFGGTDPGRFVITAYRDVRGAPDIFVISQNALADNNYMHLLRRRYGDRLWIPTAADSAKAFSTYVAEIESGKRPMTAGITKENGRVQISGVRGVMEINGILAKNIFDHNNYKHDFFVEESYVIRWMYPSLSPHGVTMKINKEPLPRLTPQMVRDDLEFWDLRTRRLITSETFVRDVVARKSFSKLRSAIAGLYAHRGMRAEAEVAFLEALQLYPLSPEANFRLADVYMRAGQFAKARKIMKAFGDMAPSNTKVTGLLKQIDHIAKINQKIQELEKDSAGGKLTADRALQLAELYRQAGRRGRFDRILSSMLANKELPPFIHFQVAQAYGRNDQYDKMNQALTLCLTRMPKDTPAQPFLEMAKLYSKSKNAIGMRSAMKEYLKRTPDDWRVWLDLASLESQLGDANQASVSLGVAIRHGGDDAQKLIQSNPMLEQIQHPGLLNGQKTNP